MESEQITSEGTRSKGSLYALLERLSGWLVLVAAFLLPIFIMPGGSYAIEPAKKLLLGVTVSIALALWLISRLVSGSFTFPRTMSIYALPVLAGAYLLSSLFSGRVAHSLVGFGYETDTFASLALFGSFTFLASMFFQKQGRVMSFYNALMASAIVVFVVQAIHIGAPDSFIGQMFLSRTDSLVGKWNDSGIFFGLTLIISLLVREVELPGKKYSLLSLITLIISLIGVLFVNLPILWLPLAIFSLALVVYGVTNGFSREGYRLGFSMLRRSSSIVFIIMVLLVLFGGADQVIGKRLFALQNKLGLVTLEARPNLDATATVTRETLKDNAILGVGPNNFDRQWRLYKPAEVNQSAFWNTDFKAGYGYLFSVPVVVGVVGAIAWAFFLGSWILAGLRGLYQLGGNREQYRIALSVLIAGVYLWVMATIYLPENVILAYAFLFSGMLVAVLASAGVIRTASVHFAAQSRLRFVTVFAFVLLTFMTLTGSYVFASRYMGSRLYQQALSLDPSQADNAALLLGKAIKKDGQALYYRGVADVGVIRINRIFADTSGNPDELRAKFQGVFSESLAAAQKAVELDPKDYQNHISLGRLYETLIPAKIEGAYQSAFKAYNDALILNGKNPAAYMHLARLSFVNKDEKSARSYIEQGLAQKSNFTELHFLLSQLEAGNGNTKAAIESALRTVQLEPNDIGAWFQLGLLYYTDKDYTRAATALEQAVARDGNYSNARYFLGLSYDRLGKSDQAIAQFEKIKALNPDNDEVKKILSNLYAGRAALANIGGTAPEKRATPPVKEDR